MKQKAGITVALVDDHAMVRQALASVLAGEGLIEVVAQAKDTREAVTTAREHEPSVLVLDYNLPGGGALHVLEEVGRLELKTRVLILTVHESWHYAVRVLEAGAQGFVVKSSAVHELREAVERVHAGEIYITPQLSQRVLDHLRQPRTERAGIAALSAREFEVLRVLGSGKGIKEAALELKVSVSTASTYRARVMKKLNLSSTTDLIRFALENGITD